MVAVAPLLYIPVRQSICHGVQTPRAVLHREVEAEELADPLVLRNGG